MAIKQKREMIGSRRELLLVEIERRCGEPRCGARVRVGLTKAEALAYTGFECERCGRRQPDALSESDIPEWWEELFVTNLDAVRGISIKEAVCDDETGPDEFIIRLSEEWRRARIEAGAGGDNPFSGGRED